MIGGLDTPQLHDIIMAQILGDLTHGQERVSVNWPAEAGPYTGRDDLTLGQSIAVGIDNLNAEITAALGRLTRDENGNVLNGEKVTVIGLSAGSLVTTEVLRQMAADPNAVGADEISFYLVADSSRQELIKDSKYNPKYDYTYQPAPDTVYDTHVITGEFDGLADMPDRWWNLTAVVNAMAGAIVVHIPVMFADLDDVPAENITVKTNALGGTTTHYLVPTEELPLVTLLPFLKPMEESLRASVERGYKRYDDVPSAARTASVATVAAEPAEDTTVSEPVKAVEAAVEESADTEDTAPVDVADTVEVVETDADDTEKVTELSDEIEVAKDDDEAVEETVAEAAEEEAAEEEALEEALADDAAEAESAKEEDAAEDATASDGSDAAADDSDTGADSDTGDDSSSDDSGSASSGSDE
ncbi:PE-PPE domain-containing protein [Mycolicibacterium sp. OfavD-34-C]|uniref:PE-PPE domain-containing protein n=1 Tax=Mycolicibacterium sp. OfavD-34-C TaxID=2917746 RepID=UPI0027E02185|nr:PE-PPE domain-containing protein [Mycolicibacterium sp. OfavD-34-C]